MVRIEEIEEEEVQPARMNGRPWMNGSPWMNGKQWMKDILTNKIERDELKPGDHVYSWRVAYSYAHHGIYVGDGKIIHFTRAAGQETGTGTALDNLFVSSSPANSSGIPCEICGDQSMLRGVLKSCIDCFLAGGDLHLFQYSVSTALFIAQARGGTCTLAHSDPPEEVLHRANYLKENGFGAYCIFKNNCEDFAIYCKTGLLVTTKVSVGLSGQLSSFLAVTSTVISSPLRMLTTSFGGLTVMASGMYCVNRYLSDIGIRRDVTKVPVERMVERLVINEPETATQTAM